MEKTNPPTKEEIEKFWRPIYENDKSHNDNAQWINDHIKYIDKLNLDEQQLPIWESKDVSEAIKKMSDWKGAGVDNLQIYKFTGGNTLASHIIGCLHIFPKFFIIPRQAQNGLRLPRQPLHQKPTKRHTQANIDQFRAYRQYIKFFHP